MRLSLLASLLLASSLTARLAHADPIDQAGARELLKQGYQLKQQRKYAEALERLLESLRLDSQVKTLINIADCEEQLGHLVLAQKHWILARDQAQLQGAEPARSEAERRLSALEQRMPRLTIKLTEPSGLMAEVRRDGVLLGRVALGIPLPVDAGPHEVRVNAPGRAEQRYSVEAVDGETKLLEVTVGPDNGGGPTPVAVAARPLAAGAPSPPAVAPAREVAAPSPERSRESGVSLSASQPGHDGLWSVQRVASLSVAGLGVVAFGAAGYSWWRANAQHDEAQGACAPQCSDAARGMQGSAQDNARRSTIFAIAGGVLLGGGAALWLTAPSAPRRVALVPLATGREAAILAQGRF